MKSFRAKTVGMAVLAAAVLGISAAGGVCAAPAADVKEEKSEWQMKVSFPDWKGYPDDTLAMNCMCSFFGYHGQGYLSVETKEEVESFRLYVNGTAVDTSGMCRGKEIQVDIAGFTRDGKNTIQVSNIIPADLAEAVTVSIPYPVILPGNAEEEGISGQALEMISDLIEEDIAHGFTSAQLAVVKNGRLVYEDAWGKTNSCLPDGTKNEASSDVTADTLYDLASLTKMFSVNYAMQKLVTDGELDLDARVTDFLGEDFVSSTILPPEEEEDTKAKEGAPVKEQAQENGELPDLETIKAWKADLTLRDLLRHQGGFPADPKYPAPRLYKEDLAEGETYPENPLFAGNGADEATKLATIEAIKKTPLEYEPGTKTVYSDLDYMVLGLVVEQITGEDLNTWLKKTFWDPMDLTHITYRPLDNGFAAEDIAATELNGNTRDGLLDFDGYRTYTLQGEVHDEKAWYSMQGISGHAGLFANAADLAKLASVMLCGGYGEHRFFSRNVMDMFTAPKQETAANWGLGWWRQGDDQRVWYFGTQAGSGTIGHQGWTGTLVMIDPERELVVVYLTNKINSPVTDVEKDANRFNGGWYTASTLGFVPQILSIGMDQETDISLQLLDLSADMAIESLKLIPKEPDLPEGHPATRNADSKVALFERLAERSEDPDRAEQLRKIVSAEVNKFAEAKAAGFPEERTNLPETADTDTDQQIQQMISEMTTEEKLAQMMVVALRSDASNSKLATGINEDYAELLRKYDFGGILLFTGNITDTEQAVTLIRNSQEAAMGSRQGIPMFVCVDQEGGMVNRVSFGMTSSGNMALAAAGDPALSEESARMLGDEIRALGFNMDFAPVSDVNSNPANPVIGVRSFSDDPEMTAAYVTSFIRGLKEAGIATALKHFPGHGNVGEDSHTHLPCSDFGLDEIKACDLIPFQAGIDEGTDMIMTAHIQYPRIEKETYTSVEDGEEIFLPATLSRTIITGLLREQMGYNGIVITDAMGMDAIAAHFDPIDAAVLAINAGVDILLCPVDLYKDEEVNTFPNMDAYMEKLLARVEEGEITQEELNDSVFRILKLKKQKDIDPDAEWIPVEEQTALAENVVGTAAHHAREWEIAQAGMTLLKNEGNALPLDGKRSVLILYPTESRKASVDYAIGRLQKEGLLDASLAVSMCYQDLVFDQDEALQEELEKADQVVILSQSVSRNGEICKVIGQVHESGKQAVLLSLNLPYDAACYPEADAVLCAYQPYGSAHDEEGNGPFNLNVAVALCTAFHQSVPSGTLPVNVPKIQVNEGEITFETDLLYERGFGLSNWG